MAWWQTPGINPNAGGFDPFSMLKPGGGLFSGTQIPQGGVLGEPQINPQQDARMAIAAQLLAGSGYSPQRRSFGEVMGQALMAGQQARQGAQQQIAERRQQESMEQLRQAQIQQMQAPPPESAEIRTLRTLQGDPELLAMYQQMNASKESTPASVQEWKFFQSLPGEQQAQYLNMKRQPTMPQVVDYMGGKAWADRVNQTITPVSSAQQEAAAQAELAKGKAVGTAMGEAQGSIEKKAIGAGATLATLDLADPLIDAATGSLAGAGRDKLLAAFGEAPTGAKAIAQLKILESQLILNAPRLEGPQGVLDLQLYREAAGQLGDPTVPTATKKAAVKTIREISLRNQKGGSAPSAGGWGKASVVP